MLRFCYQNNNVHAQSSSASFFSTNKGREYEFLVQARQGQASRILQKRSVRVNVNLNTDT